jgi:hypothetical protein
MTKISLDGENVLGLNEQLTEITKRQSVPVRGSGQKPASAPAGRSAQSRHVRDDGRTVFCVYDAEKIGGMFKCPTALLKSKTLRGRR